MKTEAVAASTSLAPRIASALLEINAAEPQRASRLALRSICALFAALVAWALLAKLDIVAVAEGSLVPQTAVKIVQPAENGIVREILIKEGDAVQAGQVLIRLDPTVAAADNRSVQGQLALKRLELRRVDAQLIGHALRREPDDDVALFTQVQADAAGRTRNQTDLRRQEEATVRRLEAELASSRENLSKLQRTLPSFEQSAKAYAKLAADKLVGTLDADAKQREYVEREQDLKAQLLYVRSLEASFQSQRARLAQLDSRYRSELQSERVQLASAIAQLDEEGQKQGFRAGLLELKAPQAGIVKDLATTTVGAVVQPGSVLLSLVPVGEPLVAEVYVHNQDIGFVREGQMARIKLSAYPFTKYGILEGKVKTVSADAARLDAPRSVDSGSSSASTSSAGPSPFKARVQLDGQTLTLNGISLPIAAGMQVQAEIRQGQRTVMEYLLSPVKRVVNEAGGER